MLSGVFGFQQTEDQLTGVFAPVREDPQRELFSDTHDSFYAFDHLYRTFWGTAENRLTEALEKCER